MLSQNDMDKNLKDTEPTSLKDTLSIPAPYEAEGFRSGSYKKTNKLITALYMVTDIVDKDEPLRHKLRSLGVEIISDIHSTPSRASVRITEVVSFLNIASAMNLISEMNSNILKKEFLELSHTIKESMQTKPAWLEEFMLSPLPKDENFTLSTDTRDEIKSIGHRRMVTSIGVQKGSTLMQALSDKTKFMSDRNIISRITKDEFDKLKKERRSAIAVVIKNTGGSATIKDIKNGVKEVFSGATVVSEKTLQRELVSLTKEGVLKKVGEKRWSRYFLIKP